MDTANIICDSVSPAGHRLTTIEITIHRFILPEFNTHRIFSRSSASSRAIPVSKQIEKILSNTAEPCKFGVNKQGMQADQDLSGNNLDKAKETWNKAMHSAVRSAEKLNELNVHKQIINRLLEPFMWHTVIVSSTEWENFFNQRCSPLAQPEIKVVADAIREKYNNSSPKIIGDGEWHTPYIQKDEENLSRRTKVKLSAARCARVSYLTHDGIRDTEKDLDLYNKLTTANPPHLSPLEHVATPYKENCVKIISPNKIRLVSVLGNFLGWKQLRHQEENIMV